MKFARLVIFLAGTIVPSAPVVASTSSAGIVSHLIVENGLVFFDQSGARTATPACATVQRWVFNASTAQGQAMLSAILTFEARRAQMTVFGTAACGDWGDTESVLYIEEVPSP